MHEALSGAQLATSQSVSSTRALRLIPLSGAWTSLGSPSASGRVLPG